MIAFIRTDHYSLGSGAATANAAINIGDVVAKTSAGTLETFNYAATDGAQLVANIVGVAVTQHNDDSAATGNAYVQRTLPDQDGDVITYVVHCPISDANSGFYLDAGQVRRTINYEVATSTGAIKAQLKANGFSFLN